MLDFEILISTTTTVASFSLTFLHLCLVLASPNDLFAPFGSLFFKNAD
jgi:hypothetical protein